MLNLFVLIEAYDTLKQFRRSLCDCNSVVFTINPDLRNPWIPGMQWRQSNTCTHNSIRRFSVPNRDSKDIIKLGYVPFDSAYLNGSLIVYSSFFVDCDSMNDSVLNSRPPVQNWPGTVGVWYWLLLYIYRVSNCISCNIIYLFDWCFISVIVKISNQINTVEILFCIIIINLWVFSYWMFTIYEHTSTVFFLPLIYQHMWTFLFTWCLDSSVCKPSW